MPKLKFFDLKAKKPFETDEFELTTRSGRRFAVAEAPSGVKSFRAVSKDFKR